MTWSDRFVADLGRFNLRPRFRLQRLRVASDIKGGLLLDSDTQIREVRTYSGDLSPADWTSTVGGFSVTVAGPIVPHIRTGLKRGIIAALYCGFEGYERHEFERIAVGQLVNITRSGLRPEVTLEFADLFAALASRLTLTQNEQALFHGLDAITTTTTGSYTAGSSTLSVASTSAFERQDDGSGTLKGGIRISPTGGDPFYLTWTSKTATTFTGLSATGQAGTTAVNANNGDAVAEIVWIDDHPLDLARRVLVSTGTQGQHGDYDTLPASWGMALPEWLVDMEDIRRYKLHSQAATGTDDWHIVATAEQSNPLDWLQTVLRAGAYFLTIRQGSITARCALPPISNQPALQVPLLIASPLTITDDHVSDVPSWEAYNADFPVEYLGVKVSGGTGYRARLQDLETLPAAGLREYDASAYVWTNEENVVEAIRDRVWHWATRIPERLDLTCPGLRSAILTQGDMPQLDLSMIQGRSPLNYEGYKGRALVTSVDVDWMNARVNLTLAVPDTFSPQDFATGFEGGVLGELATGGAANWSVTSSTSSEGTYSAQSGNITHGETTYMELVWQCGSTAKITFDQLVDTESGFDFLRFYVDGVKQDEWSGAIGGAGGSVWTSEEFSLTEGQHTFRWAYEKDGSADGGSDTVWVDNIKITHTE